MKYLTQPITNYLNGFTRQSIADENDAILNNQLNVLEKLNVQFCKELKFSVLQLRTRDSKNWGTILSKKKETIVNETKHSGKMIQSVSKNISIIVSNIASQDKNNMKINTKDMGKRFSDLSQTIFELTKTQQDKLESLWPSVEEVKRNSTAMTIKISTACKNMRFIEDIKKTEIINFLDNIRNIHKYWSTITFVIMFLPGIVVGIYILTSKGLKNNERCPLYQCPLWFQITLLMLGILTTFIFPIGMLCTVSFECLIVFLAYCGFNNFDNNILQTLVFVTEMTTALEAFFESGPQIIHQLYIVFAKKEITATQATSITLSLVIMAKTTVMYDMLYNETGTGKRSISQTVMYVLAILPLYVSSVIFKTGSIAIFFMFFGFYAIFGLAVIWLVLLFVTLKMGFSLSDGPILSLTNLLVVSTFWIYGIALL